jgi:hypothetical protein
MMVLCLRVLELNSQFRILYGQDNGKAWGVNQATGPILCYTSFSYYLSSLLPPPSCLPTIRHSRGYEGCFLSLYLSVCLELLEWPADYSHGDVGMHRSYLP